MLYEWCTLVVINRMQSQILVVNRTNVSETHKKVKTMSLLLVQTRRHLPEMCPTYRALSCYCRRRVLCHFGSTLSRSKSPSLMSPGIASCRGPTRLGVTGALGPRHSQRTEVYPRRLKYDQCGNVAGRFRPDDSIHQIRVWNQLWAENDVIYYGLPYPIWIGGVI